MALPVLGGSGCGCILAAGVVMSLYTHAVLTGAHWSVSHPDLAWPWCYPGLAWFSI